MDQVENIHGIQSISEQQLIDAKATKELAPVVSSSGIQYNIPTYLWADKVNRFVMVVLQNDDGNYRRRWILVSKADQVLKTAGPNILTKFPPAATDRFLVIHPYCSSILTELDKPGTTQTQVLSDIRPTIQNNLKVKLQQVLFLLTKIQEGRATPQEMAALPQLQQLKIETERNMNSTNQCVDLLSEFIVPQQQIIQTTPQTVIPQQPLQGFRQVPLTPSIGLQRVRRPVPLSPSVQQDVDKFMRLESCSKSEKVFRVDSVISQIQSYVSDPSNKRCKDKFLNLSTCHFGEANKNEHDTFIGKAIPGSNLFIFLSIKKTDSSRLIRGIKDRLTDKDEH